jgi:SAM-dependent methyltransferase
MALIEIPNACTAGSYETVRFDDANVRRSGELAFQGQPGTGYGSREAGMAEANVEQVRRYILDGSDEDLRRLLTYSQVMAETARRAFRRVGLGANGAAIDCGCGPIGGLAVLAEIVGAAGRVVGVDFSEPAIQRARSAMAALGLPNVQLVAGDIHYLDQATLGGPFDLAFTRNFLTFQADPVQTLRQIAGLLRPGGWIVAQEPLASPPPQSHPELGALATCWDVLQEVTERVGVPRAAVASLPRSARAAGLEVVEADGFFLTMDPELGFELHAATLAAAAERAAKSGVAAETIDDLVLNLRAAKVGGYDWVSTPFYLDLILRKPTGQA